MNGFSYFNTTNRNAISNSTFAAQRGEFLDRYTTIKFKDTANYQSYYRFRVSEKYSNYNTVINTDVHPKFFRIVRFDDGGPNKAILIGVRYGEVLVCKASELLALENIDADFCNKIKNRAKLAKYDYFEPKETLSGDELLRFFESYNNEKIYEYPVQDPYLVGREVWIEYNSSLTEAKSTNNIITTTDPETGETKAVKNDFSFTAEMRSRLTQSNSKLLNEKDYYLSAYPYTHNVHAQSNIDMPRRTTKKGVIIRADVQSVDPHIVVMEYSDDNSIRFICDDEARFYIDTEVENTEGLTFNAYEVSSFYTPIGYSTGTDSESSEEESEEETTPEEEESSEDEGSSDSGLPAYEDVVIYIDSNPNNEEEDSEISDEVLQDD